MRRSGYASDNGVFYNLRDHLSSSSVLLNQNATVNGNRNYFFPFGGNRGGATFNDVTTKRFTGQHHVSALPGGEGLSYYGARWYDAKLGRFLSADTIVPGPANPQALNRYSYVLNAPTGLVDPSGHGPCSASGGVTFCDNARSSGSGGYSSLPTAGWGGASPFAASGNPGVYQIYLPLTLNLPIYHPTRTTQARYSFPQYSASTPSRITNASKGSGWLTSAIPDYYFEGIEIQGAQLAGIGRGWYYIWDAQNNQLLYASGNYGGFTGLGFGFTAQAVLGFGHYSSEKVNPQEVLAGKSHEAGPDGGIGAFALSLSRGSNAKYADTSDKTAIYWKLGGNATYGFYSPVSYHWTESNMTTVQLLIQFESNAQMASTFQEAHPNQVGPDFFDAVSVWMLFR